MSKLPAFALYLGDQEDHEVLRKMLSNQMEGAKPHPHSQLANDLEQRINNLVKETEKDGWEKVGVTDGVEVLKKDLGDPFLLTKGTTIVEGFSPEHVFAVTMTFGTRRYWDTFFESGKMLNNYDRASSTGYVIAKGSWPIAGRDTLVFAYIMRNPDGSIFQGATSIELKDVLVPKDKVRAKVDIAAWACYPVISNGKPSTQLQYFSRVDLAGSLPASAFKFVATQTPLMVGRVRDYILKHNVPPFYLSICGNLDQTTEFDHETKTYEVFFMARKNLKERFFELYMTKENYPNGFVATFNDPELFIVSIYESNCFIWQGWHLRLVPTDTLNKKKMRVKVTRGKSKDKAFIVNGVSMQASRYEDRDLSLELEPEANSITNGQLENKAGTNVEAEVNQQSLEEKKQPTGIVLNLASHLLETHAYSKNVQELMNQAKQMYLETRQEGWQDLPGSTPALRIQQKSVPNHPLGLLRGDAFIKGITPEQVFATIRDQSCRKIWDHQLFDFQEIRKVIDCRTFLMYIRAKGQFPASARDFSVVLSWERDKDGTIIYAAKSITDAAIAEQPGVVRSHVDISIWTMKPENFGTYLTYISLNNPNGWLPGSLLKMVTKEVPKGAVSVKEFIEEFGPPPTIKFLAGNLESADFDQESSNYTFKFKHDPSELYPYTLVILNEKRYSNGAAIQVSPPGSLQAQIFTTGELALIPTTAAQPGQLIVVSIKKHSGPRRYIFNGTALKDNSRSQKKPGLDEGIAEALMETQELLKEAQSQLDTLNQKLEILEKQQVAKRAPLAQRIILVVFMVASYYFLRQR